MTAAKNAYQAQAFPGSLFYSSMYGTPEYPAALAIVGRCCNAVRHYKGFYKGPPVAGYSTSACRGHGRNQ